MAEDIFERGNLDSLVAHMITGLEPLELKDIDLPTYEIFDNYQTVSCHFSADQREYGQQIRAVVDPIAAEAESKGSNPNLHTALYEAVLNAHQHGHDLDPSKTIKIAYKITEEKAEIAVVDEGGTINPAFIPFVFRHRRGDHKERFIDFYQFSGRKQPARNNGTGTSFMHTYVDSVHYFKSESGGLVVHLTKKWEPHKE